MKTHERMNAPLPVYGRSATSGMSVRRYCGENIVEKVKTMHRNSSDASTTAPGSGRHAGSFRRTMMPAAIMTVAIVKRPVITGSDSAAKAVTPSAGQTGGNESERAPYRFDMDAPFQMKFQEIENALPFNRIKKQRYAGNKQTEHCAALYRRQDNADRARAQGRTVGIGSAERTQDPDGKKENRNQFEIDGQGKDKKREERHFSDQQGQRQNEKGAEDDIEPVVQDTRQKHARKAQY
jgi:hypothetical protein